MNKQEAIKKVEQMGEYERFVDEPITKLSVINILNQLDEPQKVVVPQFVADWYEKHKDNLEYNIWDWMKYNLEPKKQENVIFSQWLGKTVNKPVETLIKMKLYGYEVEEKLKYTVKVKAVLGQYLGRYYLNNEELIPQFIRTQYTGKEKLPTFTRKELEEAGFGWIFSCEGIEVEEVE